VRRQSYMISRRVAVTISSARAALWSDFLGTGVHPVGSNDQPKVLGRERGELAADVSSQLLRRTENGSRIP